MSVQLRATKEHNTQSTTFFTKCANFLSSIYTRCMYFVGNKSLRVYFLAWNLIAYIPFSFCPALRETESKEMLLFTNLLFSNGKITRPVADGFYIERRGMKPRSSGTSLYVTKPHRETDIEDWAIQRECRYDERLEGQCRLLRNERKADN